MIGLRPAGRHPLAEIFRCRHRRMRYYRDMHGGVGR